jgi:hypothetical protein
MVTAPFADKPCMERRREPRIQAYQKVDLILLGNDAAAIEAHATQFSGRGLRLVVKEPVPVGTVVKVQGDDWLVLGEVCYCRKERLNFAVGLQLEHSLMGLQELKELNRKFTNELKPVEVPALFALDVAQ